MDRAEEFAKRLRMLADSLENQRVEIYQTTDDNDEDKQNVSDRLFALQSQIRDVAAIVEYTNFTK